MRCVWELHHRLTLFLTHTSMRTITFLERVSVHPSRRDFSSCTSHAESLARSRSPTHLHTPNQLLCSSWWVCILFPEVLISCLASGPALPSSLCPLCPEQSGGQPTLPLDWRLFLLHINRSRSICRTLMKILLYDTKAFLFHPLCLPLSLHWKWPAYGTKKQGCVAV